jgi:predicted nucleic acid-binding protein
MSKAFVDASVLFAAVSSAKGYARDLLMVSLDHDLTLVVSSFVIEEVTRNLEKKAPAKAHLFTAMQQLVGFETVDPSAEQIKTAAEYTALKDAPVVAAALLAECEYLVTYDRKHLLDVPIVAERSQLRIVTPDVVVKAVIGEEDLPPTN